MYIWLLGQYKFYFMKNSKNISLNYFMLIYILNACITQQQVYRIHVCVHNVAYLQIL